MYSIEPIRLHPHLLALAKRQAAEDKICEMAARAFQQPMGSSGNLGEEEGWQLAFLCALSSNVCCNKEGLLPTSSYWWLNLGDQLLQFPWPTKWLLAGGVESRRKTKDCGSSASCHLGSIYCPLTSSAFENRVTASPRAPFSVILHQVNPLRAPGSLLAAAGQPGHLRDFVLSDGVAGDIWPIRWGLCSDWWAGRSD